MSNIIKIDQAYFKSTILNLLFIFAVIGCSSIPLYNQETYLNFTEEKKIIFLSDTQSPIWVETLFLNKNNNDSVRSKLFRNILKDNPKAVIHLGDLVSLGFWNNDWEDLDKFITSLRNKNTNFFPIRGNHELLLFSCSGEENFAKRFPFALKTGYRVTIGSLAIILLNSNFSSLSSEEINQQQTWYQNELSKLGKDITINSIIVASHHPPFTNSTIVAPDEEVFNQFVPAFTANSKCKLFLSGHSHAFEHFKYKEKDFLVIGGGGGLQHPLDVGLAAKWKDLYDSDTNIRNFHYLELNTKADSFLFQIKKLDNISGEIYSDYQIIFHD